MDHPLMLTVVWPLCAYLVGAIPFGLIIAKAHGVDLRKVGSGNIGATNVGRALGRQWGLACFALDALKGLVPTLFVGLMLRPQAGQYAHQAAWLAVGLAAVLGHVLNPFLRFRGGKGVATSLGVVLGVWPYFTAAGAAALGVWILVTLMTRYVSLGSVVAAVGFVPLFVAFNWRAWLELWPLAAFACAVAVVIVIRHRGNIVRLWRGTENRIGGRK
jgi:glycerol-3-phosphate acyltransferase PlsY